MKRFLRRLRCRFRHRAHHLSPTRATRVPAAMLGHWVCAACRDQVLWG